MYVLSQEELKMLISVRGEPCLSLFMSCNSVEGKQNQIRFKNLLKRAEDDLLNLGMRREEARGFLAPAQGLLNNPLFWRQQGNNLAIFVSGNDFHYLALPLVLEDLIVVSDRYHIKPLFSLLGQNWRFYLLALSQNHTRLYEGTSHQLNEIETDKIPKSMALALQMDEPEKQVKFRSSGSASGDRGGMISGHGAELEDTKDNLLKYFRLIDRGLRDLLKEEKAPLVIAGVDYLFPIYKEANTYPHLLKDTITGNPKGMTLEELHKQAWQIVKPHFSRSLVNALSLYRQSLGTGLASNDLNEILAAAQDGRVGHLFINPALQEWGVFNREENQVIIHKKKEQNSEDLLDLAAVLTYLNGGDVFALSTNEMPDGKALAAVFRY